VYKTVGGPLLLTIRSIARSTPISAHTISEAIDTAAIDQRVVVSRLRDCVF